MGRIALREKLGLAAFAASVARACVEFFAGARTEPRKKSRRRARRKRKLAVSATGPAWSSLSDSSDRLEPPGWSSSSSRDR